MTQPSRRWSGAAAAVACIAGAALAPSANAGVTPALEEALGQALPTQQLPVVATLKNQVKAVPGSDPATVLRSLRREARRTQPGLIARLGLADVRSFTLVNAIGVRSVPDEIRRIAADPVVADVDLDPEIVLADPPAPTRPLLPGEKGKWNLEQIRAPQAWSVVGVTGSSVRIGTIDTGVDSRHPALAGRIVAWRDTIGGRPAPYDNHGHGTHTAGTLVGGDVEGSPLGVAPGARLLVAKAIEGDGTGVGSDILAAAEWLTDPDGDPATADYPKVISNSWGELSDPNDTWFRPMLKRWRALDIVAIFAAGNSGPERNTVGSPSGYPDALAIGALDRDRQIPSFSSHGPVAWENRDGLGPTARVLVKPDLAGPGVDIVSSTAGGGYQAISGTSMAAPHAAGVAALVRSANPSLTAPEVEGILRASAVDVGPPGLDNQTGDGLVDALAATRTAARLPGASPLVASFLAAEARRRARAIRAAMRLTVTQLRINRRIAVAAVARIGRLEARLGHGGVQPLSARSRVPIRSLSAHQMFLTQRIARSALRRATAAQRRVSRPSALAITRLAPVRRGRIRVTLGQLFINQRIAQAALRRVTKTETLAEARGLIPPG